MKTKQIKDLFKVSAKGHIRDITIIRETKYQNIRLTFEID